ncbi:MAG: hypothetical protein PUJ51_12005 [Clostridiales bacterium]|nr:hypothetical protein [Clostridiales bacterium]
MNSEQEQKIIAFIQWLPQNIQRFEGMVPEETIRKIASAKSTEEVAAALDKLSKEQGGDEIIPHMVEVFQKSLTSKMFNGGKLKQLLDKCQKGNKITTPRKDGVMGEASSETLSDGTKRYTLTRRRTGKDGNAWYDDTQLFITPERDTLVNIGNSGKRDPGLMDLIGTDYHTPTAIENRKKNNPIIARLFP